MQIFDRPDFLKLPDRLGALFGTSAESFFNTRGWYELVSRYGTPTDRQIELITNDGARAAFVLQADSSGRQLFSCVNPYSCDHAVIGNDETAVRQLAEEIARKREHTFRIQLEGLDTKHAAFAAISEGFRNAGYAVRPFFGWGNRFEDVAGKTFEDYLAARPSVLVSTWKRKLGALRKKARSSFRIHEPQDELDSLIAAYGEAHAKSWKEAEPFPQFIPELIRYAACIGVLRMGALKISDEVAAAQFWIVWNGQALIFKLVHADKFREFSPGTLLTMQMIQHIMVRDAPTEISFGRGDDSYKKLWVSSRRERWGIDAANIQTWRGALLAAHMQAGRIGQKLREKR